MSREPMRELWGRIMDTMADPNEVSRKLRQLEILQSQCSVLISDLNRAVSFHNEVRNSHNIVDIEEPKSITVSPQRNMAPQDDALDRTMELKTDTYNGKTTYQYRCYWGKKNRDLLAICVHNGRKYRGIIPHHMINDKQSVFISASADGVPSGKYGQFLQLAS